MDANEALEQLKQAAAEVAREAQGHLDRGAHPDAVALGLLRISDGLSDEVKTAQIGALTDGLSDEHKAAVVTQVAAGLSPEERKRLRAQLDALDAADNSAPPASPPS